MLLPSPTTAVKFPDRSDLRLRPGRGQETCPGASSPTSAARYLLTLSSGTNTSNIPAPSESPRIHSLSGTCQNLNTVINNQWSPSHGTTSAIQSAGPFKLVDLYNRTGTSSLIQNSACVELSIRDISFSAVSTSGPIQYMKTPRDSSSYQGNLKAAHKAGVLGGKIGYFSAPLTDAEIFPSSPSESSHRTSSNPSSPGPSCSGDQSASLRLDESWDQPDSRYFQLHSEDVHAWMGSHSLSKSDRQAQELELHPGVTSALYARKASRWNRKLQCELARQERRRMRQLVFFAASFIISALFLFGVVWINIEILLPQVAVSTQLTHSPAPIIDSPERDALIIYRIIGNDLPPRHSPKQTLTNLQFLLEHESDFEDISRHINAGYNSDYQDGQMGGQKLRIKKFFVLNRIANQTQLSLVEKILKSHGVKQEQILVNPFVADTYRLQPFNALPNIGWNSGLYSTCGIDQKADVLPSDNPEAIEQEISSDDVTPSNRSANSDRWRALDFTYHYKNLYAMNNNGGRNFALEHARSVRDARWILPLDGNCFFTPASLYSLVNSLQSSDLQPDPPSHVVIPMSRLLDNKQAVSQNLPINWENPSRDRSLRPSAKDEPQVGFRFTSKEIFSPNMRYGRRSKLELLWRLGAMDRHRNLDKKTGDWEVTERNILTSESYGSIQRKLRRPSSSLDLKHEAASDDGTVAGGPDFIRAGWVLRLFSGDQSQEEHSEKARSHRSVNRMKGIISFLENLDESIARGSSSCPDEGEEASEEKCGFAHWRLWSLNGEELEKMKVQYMNKDANVGPLVDRLVQLSESFVSYASAIISKGAADVGMSSAELPQEIPNAVFVLALTAYLTDDEKHADLAASLANMVFLQSPFSLTPDNAFPVSLNTQLRPLRLQADHDGFGYAFPLPRHELALPNWMKDTTIESLPFNPYTFDPTLLLDGIRLLWNDWGPLRNKPKSKWLQRSLAEKLPKQKLQELFTLQLSYLLLNDSLAEQYFNTNSNQVEGLHYAFKLGALASFTDDVRLLNRIRSRTPVDKSFLSKNNVVHYNPSENTALVFDPQIPTDLVTLYRRFSEGFSNVNLLPLADPFIPNLSSHSRDHSPSSLEGLTKFSYN